MNTHQYAIGTLKTDPKDFIVKETMHFDLTGEGEHIWLYIKKTTKNTKDVIKALASYTGIPAKNIGYSGLKDKHAETTQWFSIYYPGKQDIDFSNFEVENIEILKITRHNKKLKIGTHRLNQFMIRIRNLQYPVKALQKKALEIQANGFWNDFGDQRFGFENLDNAQKWIKGDYRPKNHEKGFLLSTLRSYLFNEYLTLLKNKSILKVGDIVGLRNTTNFFKVTEAELDDLTERFNNQEIILAAPLIGSPQKLHFSDQALSIFESFKGLM